MMYEGTILNNRSLVEKLLSKGGTGEVYIGRHTVIGKKAAIKVLSPEWEKRHDIVVRFYQEAQATSLIGHRNIVNILDAGLIDEAHPYLVMEYLEGHSLAEMMAQKPIVDTAAACGILEQILLGLDATHKKEIVHRDIKPDNIFVGYDEGARGSITIKIIDFGIAKFPDMPKEMKFTIVGLAIGTPPYMSPEQVRGSSEVDCRSDLFSAGVILYEMLTGQTPFQGESYEEIMKKIVVEPPIPPSSTNPLFPKDALPIIEKALAKNPEERYPDAYSMLEDLKKLEGYEEREQALARFAAEVKKETVCIGSEETASRYERRIPIDMKNVLSLFTPPEGGRNEKASSAEGGEQEGSSTAPTPIYSISTPKRSILFRMRKRLLIAFSITIGILIGIFLSVTFLKSNSKNVDVKSNSAPEKDLASTLSRTAVPETVTLELLRVPTNASVYVNDRKIDSTRFSTARAKEPVSVKIVAEGYIPYEYAFMPLSNRSFEVKMKPVPSDTDAAPPSVKQKGRPESKGAQPKFIRGGAGSEIAKDFK